MVGGKVLEQAGTESSRDLERFRNANDTRLMADLRIEMQKAHANRRGRFQE